MPPVIVWFRHDLRLADNPALHAAAATRQPVICLYVADDKTVRPLGGAAQWWRGESLRALDRSLQKIGNGLVVRQGDAMDILQALTRETGAAAIYWNRLYDDPSRRRDEIISTALQNGGVAVRPFNGNLLHEPSAFTTKTGGPYKVFTPFWKEMLRRGDPSPPLAAPKKLTAFSASIKSIVLPACPPWSKKLQPQWTPGETGANARLDWFLENALQRYGKMRDTPSVDGTSRLSPHLAFGEISPRQIWHRVRAFAAAHPKCESGAADYLRELVWREFSYHLLAHFPNLPTHNWNTKFDRFPWRDDPVALTAWRQGRTGYPIVDAGMRELWATGWMHNRVRMIVASFLVKHLLIPWQAGEAWFWDTLVDADPANNAASWQWVAGCGADAAPYFRIFNPVLQGEKFDADGAYVRRYVPELARTPISRLHKPWLLPAAEPGLWTPESAPAYPPPIVDHAIARDRAMKAYVTIKSP